MFLKLLKYEGIALGRWLLPFYLLFIVLYLFFTYVENGQETDIIFVSFLCFFVLAIKMLSAFVVLCRFYSNFFKDEGYLTFTLPVSVWEHVAAKFLSVLLVVVLFETLSAGILSSKGIMNFYNIFFVEGNMLEEIVYISFLCLKAYLAITLGHLLANHPIFGAVLAYIVLNIFFYSIISIVGTTDHVYVYGLPFSVICYVATCLLLREKLELS